MNVIKWWTYSFSLSFLSYSKIYSCCLVLSELSCRSTRYTQTHTHRDNFFDSMSSNHHMYSWWTHQEWQIAPSIIKKDKIVWKGNFPSCLLPPSVKSQLYYSPAVWTWDSDLSFLYPTSCLYEMAIVVVPASGVFVRVSTCAVLATVSSLCNVCDGHFFCPTIDKVPLCWILKGPCGARFWWLNFYSTVPPPSDARLQDRRLGDLCGGGAGGW